MSQLPHRAAARYSKPMRRIAVLVYGGLAAACAVGPDFHRPAAPQVPSYGAAPLTTTPAADTAGGEAQQFEAGRDIPAQWWTAFQSPQIDKLVATALAANPDLQAAQAALRAALETAAAQRGSYFPTVSAAVSSNREQNAVGTLAPTLSSGASIFTLHTAQVDVAYTPDLFGANRRQLESLLASAEAQRFQMEATYLTLVSNVIVAAITQASVNTQLVTMQAIVAGERESLEILRKQYQLGSISSAQVSAQEAMLAQTEAAVPGLQQQLAQQHDLLAQLSGTFPSELADAELDLSMLSLPQSLPLSLPARMVEQRPDVCAAEAALHAATAQVGVAIANMLPDISLTANAGTTAVRLGELLGPGTRFWSLGASLSQTLFAGGTLVHRKRAAVASMDQAAALYRSTVLQAFREVADTLAALQSDAVALDAQARAERAAAQSLAIVQQNLALGSASYLELLDAERTHAQAAAALAQAHAARLSDTVALFQALGGGWWNRATTGSSAGGA
ncbi:MAG: efflux transporter outer membrane subunit [Steroidobacterales bacterium]